MKPTSTILVAGGTGFLGQHLVKGLRAAGVEIIILSRRSGVRTVVENVTISPWEELPKLMEDVDAVVNLAGEGLADRRWSTSRKHRLWTSRLDSTRSIVDAIQKAQRKPSVLVNASAVGFYGNRSEEALDETASVGKGFLSELCQAWEREAERALRSDVRVVLFRTGVVLARDGGAFPRMVLPVKWFLGTKLGSGTQGISWIHIQDYVQLLIAAIENPAFSGPINATAPEPISNRRFMHALGTALRRPIWPIPAAATHMLLHVLQGELAEEILLSGSYIHPRKALELGFPFRFPNIETALRSLFDTGTPGLI